MYRKSTPVTRGRREMEPETNFEERGGWRTESELSYEGRRHDTTSPRDRPQQGVHSDRPPQKWKIHNHTWTRARYEEDGEGLQLRDSGLARRRYEEDGEGLQLYDSGLARRRTHTCSKEHGRSTNTRSRSMSTDHTYDRHTGYHPSYNRYNQGNMYKTPNTEEAFRRRQENQQGSPRITCGKMELCNLAPPGQRKWTRDLTEGNTRPLRYDGGKRREEERMTHENAALSGRQSGRQSTERAIRGIHQEENPEFAHQKTTREDWRQRQTRPEWNDQQRRYHGRQHVTGPQEDHFEHYDTVQEGMEGLHGNTQHTYPYHVHRVYDHGVKQNHETEQTIDAKWRESQRGEERYDTDSDHSMDTPHRNHYQTNTRGNHRPYGYNGTTNTQKEEETLKQCLLTIQRIWTGPHPPRHRTEHTRYTHTDNKAKEDEAQTLRTQPPPRRDRTDTNPYKQTYKDMLLNRNAQTEPNRTTNPRNTPTHTNKTNYTNAEHTRLQHAWQEMEREDTNARENIHPKTRPNIKHGMEITPNSTTRELNNHLDTFRKDPKHTTTHLDWQDTNTPQYRNNIAERRKEHHPDHHTQHRQEILTVDPQQKPHITNTEPQGRTRCTPRMKTYVHDTGHRDFRQAESPRQGAQRSTNISENQYTRQTERQYNEAVADRRPPQNITTPHTEKTSIDADTERNIHLKRIWQAIHIYGNTIPVTEWTKYKKIIHIALQIAHKNKQEADNWRNHRIRAPISHHAEYTVDTMGARRTHTTTDEPKQYITTQQTIHLDSTTQTPTHPQAANSVHTKSATHPQAANSVHTKSGIQTLEGKHPNIPPTKPPPTRDTRTNKISWADIVKQTPPQCKTNMRTHPPPFTQTDIQRQTHDSNREEPLGSGKHIILETPRQKTADNTKYTTPLNLPRNIQLGRESKCKPAPQKPPQHNASEITGLPTTNTQHTEFRTTLTQAWIWKTRKAVNMLTGDKFKDRENINYYTNILAGPPAYLNTQQKEAWINTIHAAKEKCRTDILIPALDDKAKHWKNKGQETNLIDAEKLEDADRTLSHVWNIWTRKGFNNKQVAKIIREANLFEDFVPTPPPIHNRNPNPTNTTTPTESQETGTHTSNNPKPTPTTRTSNQETNTHTPIISALRSAMQVNLVGKNQETNIYTLSKPTPKQDKTQPQSTYTSQITPTDIKTLSTQILETMQHNKPSEKAHTRSTTPTHKRGTLDNPPTESAELNIPYNTPKPNPARLTPRTRTGTQAYHKDTITTPNTRATMRHTQQPHQDRETDANTPYLRTQTPSPQTQPPPKTTISTPGNTNPTKPQDKCTTHNKQQHKEYTPENKSPKKQPTPIVVETPKEHYTLRPRTPIIYTQIGNYTSTQRHRPNTTNNNRKKTVTQIDLTIDTSPEASVTPRAQHIEEEDIIFYTPDRHTHTPSRQNIQSGQTPTRVGNHYKTHTKEGMTQPEYSTQKKHMHKDPKTEATPSKKGTPHTRTPVIQERTKSVANTELDTTQQNTATDNTTEPTDGKKTEEFTTTQTQRIESQRQKNKAVTRKGENIADPQLDLPKTHTITKSNSTQEKNQDCNTADKNDQPQTNMRKDNTKHQPKHTTQYHIQEEEWQTFCNETFEDIELDFSRQATPSRGQTTPPRNQIQESNQITALQNTLHQQIEAAIERKIDTNTIQEGGWQTLRKDTLTDTPPDIEEQDMETDSTHTPPRDRLERARHTRPPNIEIFQRLVDKAITLASDTNAQETTPIESADNPIGAPNQATDIANRECKSNKLKNLKRKYMRAQKKIKEGNTKRKREKRTPNMEITNTVYDYTSKGLTQTEKKVLGLGKSFITTQNAIDIDRIKTDIATFIRRLRLHYIFRERRPDERQQNLDLKRQHKNTQKAKQPHKGIHTQWRKPKSTFQPDETHRDINQIERNIEVNIATQLINRKKGKPNIPTHWMAAIDTLKHRIADKEITITQADKGGGIIAIDYEMYITKGTKYIEEEAGAYELEHTPEELIVAKLTKERDIVIKKLKEADILPIDTATYATHQIIEKITGMKFYFKIHKTTDIHTMPVRPLQSCIGSPTQHISQVLTDIFEPYITNTYIPTYIRDTNHTLYELDGTTLKETDTLAIADVIALYPSIEHEKGLKAIKDFIKEHIYDDEHKAEALTNAFRLVITQNYVKWQGNIYKQTRGVAMGTPVAVTYANIYMNAVDNKIAEACPYIKLHKRFIDDNLHIIPKDKKDAFRQTLNNIDPPALKFTVSYLGDAPHNTTLPFLDIKFYLGDNRELHTRLYTKDTDKHQYLMPYSQHPRHIIRNIPRGVFARIRRICQDDIVYKEDSDLAIGWLRDRGYNEKTLIHIREETGKRDRWQMIGEIEERAKKLAVLADNNTNHPTTIPFINTYSTPTKDFGNIIRSQKRALDDIFTRARVKTLNAYRRKQNLGDLLIQPSLRIPIEGRNTAPRVFKRCGKHPHTKPCPCTGLHDQTICRVCAHIAQDNINIKTRITRPINCDSKNIIYIIWCDACNMKYIGETQQRIRDRFTQHLYNLDILDQDFYNHFRQPGHGAIHMKLAILETLQTNEPLYRKIKESTWIRKLKTYTPFGLNSKIKESPLDTLQKPNTQIDDIQTRHNLDTNTTKRPQTQHRSQLHKQPTDQQPLNISNHKISTPTKTRNTSQNLATTTQRQRPDINSITPQTRNARQSQTVKDNSHQSQGITRHRQYDNAEQVGTPREKVTNKDTTPPHTHHKHSQRSDTTTPTRQTGRLSRPTAQTQ